MFLSGVGFHTPAFPPGGPETLKYKYFLKLLPKSGIYWTEKSTNYFEFSATRLAEMQKKEIFWSIEYVVHCLELGCAKINMTSSLTPWRSPLCVFKCQYWPPWRSCWRTPRSSRCHHRPRLPQQRTPVSRSLRNQRFFIFTASKHYARHKWQLRTAASSDDSTSPIVCSTYLLSLLLVITLTCYKTYLLSLLFVIKPVSYHCYLLSNLFDKCSYPWKWNIPVHGNAIAFKNNC